MKKSIRYRHLDTDKTMEVVLSVTEEGDRFVSRLESGAGPDAFKAPTFYGSTAEQAERMMRKVLEREYESIEERVIEG